MPRSVGRSGAASTAPADRIPDRAVPAVPNAAATPGHARLRDRTDTDVPHDADLRDTGPEEWFEQAGTAESAGDRDTAVARVSAHAACCSADHHMRADHLWRMDLLARSERFSELAEPAHMDVHARRRLNRSLGERGMATASRSRAEDGDRTPSTCLCGCCARGSGRGGRPIGPGPPLGGSVREPDRGRFAAAVRGRRRRDPTAPHPGFTRPNRSGGGPPGRRRSQPPRRCPPEKTRQMRAGEWGNVAGARTRHTTRTFCACPVRPPYAFARSHDGRS